MLSCRRHAVRSVAVAAAILGQPRPSDTRRPHSLAIGPVRRALVVTEETTLVLGSTGALGSHSGEFWIASLLRST